jgi:preprotein translocase subunit SecG
MKNILNIIEIIVAILMVTIILLQNKGVGLSATFGGEGNIYRSKRGIEKGLFVITVILAIAFGALAILQLIIK